MNNMKDKYETEIENLKSRKKKVKKLYMKKMKINT